MPQSTIQITCFFTNSNTLVTKKLYLDPTLAKKRLTNIIRLAYNIATRLRKGDNNHDDKKTRRKIEQSY